MPVVGLISVELHLPHARSLKEKRAVLRSVKDRLRRLNVSAAEVDHQDLHQRATVAVTAVGSDRMTVSQTLDAVADEFERRHDGLVIQTEIEWLR